MVRLLLRRLPDMLKVTASPSTVHLKAMPVSQRRQQVTASGIPLRTSLTILWRVKHLQGIRYCVAAGFHDQHRVPMLQPIVDFLRIGKVGRIDWRNAVLRDAFRAHLAVEGQLGG